ncbi:MAG: hypothetical protein HY897_26195 [Deltaproteobacteria bacterium]|nr:hypothetical protein [Deltaproteobacteria bacterium]
MPARDPRLKNFRVAVYIAYGLLVGWIVVSFTAAVARGVFSDEGRERLALRRAMMDMCGAAAAMAPPLRIEGCPDDVPAGNFEALLGRARKTVSRIRNGPQKDRLAAALHDIESASRPVPGAAPAHRAAEAAREFLE